MAENSRDYPRLGVSVGKGFGSAVERNRLKRMIREVFRQEKGKIPSSFDYLLMFSPKLSKKFKSVEGKPTFDQVKSAFLGLVADAAGKIEK